MLLFLHPSLLWYLLIELRCDPTVELPGISQAVFPFSLSATEHLLYEDSRALSLHHDCLTVPLDCEEVV